MKLLATITEKLFGKTEDRVPESIRVEMQCHVVSDSTDAEMRIVVGGRCKLSALNGIGLAEFEQAAIATANATLEVDDFRAMTLDEVEDYRKRQDEEEIESGAVVARAKLYDSRDVHADDIGGALV